MTDTTHRTPHVLLILDGWGYTEQTESNAIRNADTPFWDSLVANYPNTLIGCSGEAVGLPAGQMGNSEVGHMNLGAGRVVYQDFTRISKSIRDGDFFDNAVLTSSIDDAVKRGKAVHLMGLCSPGGVHSHEDHIAATIELAVQRGAEQIYLHAFLDGRDTAPRSAKATLERLDTQLRGTGKGRIASLIGRYFAMDRDQRWERVQLAYDLLTEGKAAHQVSTALEGLQQSYDRDTGDEFVEATRVAAEGESAATVNEGDCLIFLNFRADRAREISYAFTDPAFAHFERPYAKLNNYVMLTEYAASIDAKTAFPAVELKNSLGEYLSGLGKTQLRIAETEKYAHVTFFFSGGQEDPYAGETRELIPSPDVATYDLQPEMSAPEVTAKLVAAIKSGDYDTIICNYANGDMVGHTGVYEAAIKAAETIDQSLKAVIGAVIECGGHALITADHGNCEQMLDPSTQQPMTAHTTNKVPLIYVGQPADLKSDGALSDIAPTMLKLMGLSQPEEMSGESLVEFR